MYLFVALNKRRPRISAVLDVPKFKSAAALIQGLTVSCLPIFIILQNINETDFDIPNVRFIIVSTLKRARDLSVQPSCMLILILFWSVSVWKLCHLS